MNSIKKKKTHYMKAIKKTRYMKAIKKTRYMKAIKKNALHEVTTRVI